MDQETYNTITILLNDVFSHFHSELFMWRMWSTGCYLVNHFIQCQNQWYCEAIRPRCWTFTLWRWLRYYVQILHYWCYPEEITTYHQKVTEKDAEIHSEEIAITSIPDATIWDSKLITFEFIPPEFDKSSNSSTVFKSWFNWLKHELSDFGHM